MKFAQWEWTKFVYMQNDKTKLPKFNMHIVNATTCILIALIFVFVNLFNHTYCQNSVQTIVIDAGHGGKDPGCHGKFSKEKHVCLSMALKLGALIQEKYPNIKVKQIVKNVKALD